MPYRQGAGVDSRVIGSDEEVIGNVVVACDDVG